MSKALLKPLQRKLAILAVCAMVMVPMVSIFLELALLPGVLNVNTGLKNPPSVDAIQNFFVVKDYLFRGAQPSPLGMLWLKNHSVKTIVDLREAGSAQQQGEAVVARAMGFAYVNLSVKNIPSIAQLRAFIDIVETARAQNRRVFVHCCSGSDRTGAFVGAWRLVGEHWRPSAAFAEMLVRGFIVHRLGDWQRESKAHSRLP